MGLGRCRGIPTPIAVAAGLVVATGEREAAEVVEPGAVEAPGAVVDPGRLVAPGAAGGVGAGCTRDVVTYLARPTPPALATASARAPTIIEP
jgi:hypothetical protein